MCLHVAPPSIFTNKSICWIELKILDQKTLQMQNLNHGTSDQVGLENDVLDRSANLAPGRPKNQETQFYKCVLC